MGFMELTPNPLKPSDMESVFGVDNVADVGIEMTEAIEELDTPSSERESTVFDAISPHHPDNAIFTA